MTGLLELAERLERAAGPKTIKFGVWPTGGWVIAGARETVELLCAVWNARVEIGNALRARHHIEGNRE
jgi:hypothetical protein